jgi:hypothetical protein
MQQTLTNTIAEKLSSTPKEAYVSTFLVANAFVWYLSGLSYLQDAANSRFGDSTLLLAAMNFLGLVFSAFVVSSLTGKIKNRLTFLKYWLVAGSVLSILFAAVNFAGFAGILVMSTLIGVYFGVGMPICMGFYAKATVPQNRAKLSGLIILLIGISFPLISIIGGGEALLLTAALAVCPIVSLTLALTIKSPTTQKEFTEKVTYRSVISNKTFLLYALPWLMFSLINELTMQLNTTYFAGNSFPAAFGQNFLLIENVLAGASAIICGFLADKKGRKRLALTGFVLLGVGYASLGLFNGNLYAALFYVCVDGFAWGAISMLFIVTVWGDITQEKSSEKYYFLGVMPYLFSNLAGVLIGSNISAVMGESMVFSFASFFLFTAVLPLVYAPETLSDKILKKFDLDSYVTKALENAKKSDASLSAVGVG